MAEAGGAGGKWGDLGPRVMSAIVLTAVALAALFGGALSWSVLVLTISILLLWELGPLCSPGLAPWKRALLAATPVLASALTGLAAEPALWAWRGLALGLAPLLGLVLLSGGRAIWAGYTLLIAAGVAFLVFLYDSAGPWGVVALVALVAISDMLGYFVGRLIGGPKFWPRVSPKKTWSGTVAGWVGAALFAALALPALFHAPMQPRAMALFALLGALLALAGQMGDIAESAIKRRAGVKDASNLIPGHGGFLDRLDALIAASALGLVLALAYLGWPA